MQRILWVLLDWCFPPRATEMVIRAHSTDTLPTYTTTLEQGMTTSLLSYHAPLIRACITEAKFHYNHQAYRLLAKTLDDYLAAHATNTILIPIPLSAARQRSRGYNQVTEILKKLPKQYKIVSALKRTRDTTPQTSLTRTDRLTNMHDAFVVNKPVRITNQHVIIIDDVTTTGTTLEAARTAVRAASPASITCIALAH